MNIYRTKTGEYINVDNILYVYSYSNGDAKIFFTETVFILLRGDQGKSFLEYLDYHLKAVYTGWA